MKARFRPRTDISTMVPSGQERTLVIVALLMALLLGLSAAPATAAVTGIRMDSDPLDPIGMGMTYDLGPADGAFTLTGDAGQARIAFQPAGAGDPWVFTFEAPTGGTLAPGAMMSPVSVTQSPSPSGLPSMSVSGGGRNCSWVSGAFEIHEFTLDAAGLPASARITFEQHCDGDVPALRGEVLFNADLPVDVRAPFAQFANPGETIVFFALATEESGGWVSFTADGVPPGAFFMDFFDNSAVFVWTPLPSDVGTHRLTIRADNGFGGVGTSETVLRIGPPSAPPVAMAGGPYEGRAGSPVLFDGSSSFDPDSPSLTAYWDFGDGATAASLNPEHAYSAAGSYTARLVVCDEDRCVMDEARVDVVAGAMAARAFVTPDDKVIRLGTGRPWFTVRVEPDAGEFALNDVDLSSLVLRSEGTGSRSTVACVPGRTALGKDADRNKQREIDAVFATSDLRDLFSNLDGEKSVPVTVEGRLYKGMTFRAEIMVTVIAGPGNSLNAKLSQKSGSLNLNLARSASVTLTVFDVTGRLVRRVLEGGTLSAGGHEVSLDASTVGAPGIYFYRLEADGEVATGRIFVAR